MPTALQRAARAYIERLHWPVFPLRERGKEPLTPHGHLDATLDPAVIRRWWTEWPNANIGVPTGGDFFAMDNDPRNGSDQSMMELVNRHGRLPDTLSQMTGGRGYHRFFRKPADQRIPCITGLWPGIDIKGDGGYIVVAPSVHPSGNPYLWDSPTSIFEETINPAPAWLLMAIAGHARQNGANGDPFRLPEKIKKGVQHKTLFRMGCLMRRGGAEEPEIFAALSAANEIRCEDPGPEENIRKLARSICNRYPIGADRTIEAVAVNGAISEKSDIAPRALPIALSDLHEIFARWLYLPDMGVVTIAVAAVAANRTTGDPVWPLLIGPPSSGKTEILDSLLGLPDMHSASSLTEAALLSGTPSRDRAREASGGLLRSMGAFGFIVLKDFTSILSMARETRGPLLAALREIYDGSWIRRVGVDGGKTLEWSGKAALIGGCTPIIDQHHAVMAAMGERFILYRLGEINGIAQVRHALKHLGREGLMRRELRSAVERLFAGFSPSPFAIDPGVFERLASLASLVARCRSAVERDNYRREVELIPDSELPARIALALARLMHGMASIGVSLDEQWRLTSKAAMDCIPDLRRRILFHLVPRISPSPTKSVALGVHYPTNTTRRALEDLSAHGVITRYDRGSGKADEWELSNLSSELAKTAGIADIPGTGTVPNT